MTSPLLPTSGTVMRWVVLLSTTFITKNCHSPSPTIKYDIPHHQLAIQCTIYNPCRITEAATLPARLTPVADIRSMVTRGTAAELTVVIEATEVGISLPWRFSYMHVHPELMLI